MSKIKKKVNSRKSLIKGGLALSASLPLLSAEVKKQNHGVVSPLHLPQKCKRVIFLYMAGGPSHLESFDFKPELKKMDKKPMPESFTKGQPIAQLQGRKLFCMGPQYDFKQHGQSGLAVSSLFPYTANIADDICVIKSMKTDLINHDPAHTFMNTGTGLSGRPSMGSWINYALGNQCHNLPGFIVLTSVGGGQSQPIAARQWHSGFLPGRYQGVRFMSKGPAVLYVNHANGTNHMDQRHLIDSINQLNILGNQNIHDPEVETRMSQYEMAWRMQSSVPDLTDFSDEPQHILDMYGTKGGDGTFASNCLLARRLAERDVRFIQLYHRGWDHHSKLTKDMPVAAKYVDQASAALVSDLKQRGLLDDTLVIWGGEFGRTPMAQGSGRDHHIKGFTMWFAGGGFKAGMQFGETDELGYNAVKDVVHVRDLHATILHQLGIDHKRLTVKFQGLDQRLTGVEECRVVKEVLA